jgi:hypothetical protein
MAFAGQRVMQMSQSLQKFISRGLSALRCASVTIAASLSLGPYSGAITRQVSEEMAQCSPGRSS